LKGNDMAKRVRERKKWYIGMVYETLKYHAFNSLPYPSRETMGNEYLYVVGPFKTKRAAKWAEKYAYDNPHFNTVEDAERISKT